MPDLTHRVSYETLKFDTLDGDLDALQYAEDDEKYYLRLHPKNNYQFSVFYKEEQEDGTPAFDVTRLLGLVKVDILPEKAYYSEFFTPQGRIYREQITAQDYQQYSHDFWRPKTVTDLELELITADDALWEEVK